MEAVVSLYSHQFSSEEPLQEWPVLLFWLQGYWVKTTKPLNICLHTGSEPNYLPLLLLTHFGQIMNSTEFLGKTLIHIRDVGQGGGAAVLCWISFCLLLTDELLPAAAMHRSNWLAEPLQGSTTPCTPILTGLTSASQECKECCCSDTTYFPCKEERLGIIICHAVVPGVCS